ncbi:hypothetical protein [Pseudophaeobacter sp.]|uniref:hypothetical protein n=1 Tax=Pseudophaeobacter sp. TaxID=1971739 RepID=UPI003A97358F
MKEYSRGDRVPVRSQQIWLILTAHAVLKPSGEYEEGAGWSGWKPGLITYGDLAKQMGMDPKAGMTLGRHLGVIGYYCQQEKLPPLNAIAVNDTTGEPGYGVVETEGFTRDQNRVWKEPWFSYRPPSIKALRDVYDKHISVSN